MFVNISSEEVLKIAWKQPRSPLGNMSMIGLAGSPGTDVEPTCSMEGAFAPRADLIHWFSRANNTSRAGIIIDKDNLIADLLPGRPYRYLSDLF